MLRAGLQPGRGERVAVRPGRVPVRRLRRDEGGFVRVVREVDPGGPERAGGQVTWSLSCEQNRFGGTASR